MGLLKAMISLAVNLCLKNYIVLYFCGGSGIEHSLQFLKFGEIYFAFKKSFITLRLQGPVP